MNVRTSQIERPGRADRACEWRVARPNPTRLRRRLAPSQHPQRIRLKNLNAEGKGKLRAGGQGQPAGLGPRRPRMVCGGKASLKARIVSTPNMTRGMVGWRAGFPMSAMVAWLSGVGQHGRHPAAGDAGANFASGKMTIEERCYDINSRAVKVVEMGQLICAHWCIENQLRSELDMSWGQDASLIRDTVAARNMASLRKITLLASFQRLLTALS
jgi:hypothetical protein